MSPLQDREWFISVFRQGLEIIKRSRWLLIVPLAAAVMKFGESQLVSFIVLKKHPELAEQASRMSFPDVDMSFFGALLYYLESPIYPGIFTELGQLNSAMLSSFRSFFVLSGFLLFLMVYLLRSRPATGRDSAGGFGAKTKWRLGIASGVAGLYFLASRTYYVLSEEYGLRTWMIAADMFAYMLSTPFAHALFIPSMDAADRREPVSIATGLSHMEWYFRPIFFFVLIVMLVGTVAFLPPFMSTGFGPRFTYVLTRALTNTLFGMTAFILVIIVVRRTSFSAAFDDCINLWARHAKNAAAFIFIGALLLLIPEILRSIISDIFRYQWGWEEQMASLFISFFKVSAGTLIMCSMVVFYRKIMELEEPTTPET